LKQLVDLNIATGYDDPRLPTLVGLRRRGYTPEAIRDFVLSTGLSRINSTVSSEMLENSLRNDLIGKVGRYFAVLDPLPVTITNYPSEEPEWLEILNNADNESLGTRQLAFGKRLFIERADFAPEKPDKHWRRLSLGLEVRLIHAYFIKCEKIIMNPDRSIKELLCTYDPNTRSGSGFTDRKPNGNIHYVEATTAQTAQFNLFEPFLVDSDPDRPLLDRVNPDSWKIQKGVVEAELAHTDPGDRYQFIRDGFYATDTSSTPGKLVFNRTVELKSRVK
jgi:glutaminyl-tRNA synthetase